MSLDVVSYAAASRATARASAALSRSNGFAHAARPVATRTRASMSGTAVASQAAALSDGTIQSQSSAIRHVVIDDCFDIRLAYTNIAWGTNTANAIYVKCAVLVNGQDDNLHQYRGAFNGEHMVEVRPGETVITDPIAVHCYAGEILVSRTFVAVANLGDKWPIGFRCSPYGVLTGYSVEGKVDSVDFTSVDDPTTVNYSGSGNPLVYGPAGVLGVVPSPSVPGLFVLGDSISVGYGDTETTYDAGFVAKHLANRVPYVQASQSGEPASSYRQYVRKSRAKLISGSDYVWCGMGSNDIFNGQSLAATQASLIFMWQGVGLRGPRLLQMTIPPRTTSTDSWATTGNQTAANAGYETARIALNAWIRDGAPILNGAAVATGSHAAGTVRSGDAGHPLHDYVEVADLVETARNSGIWKVSGGSLTGDGIHPNVNGNQIVADGLSLYSKLVRYV